MRTTVLRASALDIGYPGATGGPVAGGLELELRRGQLVCLLGPNGAGKSTLMRTLAGLQPALGGQVEVDGEPLAGQRPHWLARRLAVVLTERAEPAGLNVEALVALGRFPYTGWGGRLDAADRRAVCQALADVDAEALVGRQVGELSDGERQKVMIARALAQEPDVLLLDEPTAFLDLPRRVELMRFLRRTARRRRRAVLLSTHDLDLALRVADRIWLLSQGGRLRQGEPEELVLRGDLAASFADDGVVFDRATGTFRLTEAPIANVAVVGAGEYAHWARRAVERLGLRPVSADEPVAARVEIADDGDFTLVVDGDRETGAGLGDLAATLRRRFDA